MNGARVIPRKVWLILALVAIVALVAFQLLRPLPVVAATPSVPTSDLVPGTPPLIPLPAKGEAAVGTAELGIMAASPQEQALPMASVAKLMTALVVTEDKPLAVDDTGPTIIIDSADVADYQARLAAGESVLKVGAGEQITEFDALQGLLIPSGNNIAAVLAKWDAGSVDAMIKKMNARAVAMHLANTHFEDPAGVSPKTVSTPRDLFRIAVAAMKNKVIAKVVGELQANLPVAGVVYNVNSILGQDGIIGIKTGSGIGTATGSPPISNFVFASKQTTGPQTYVIYGAVMGQDTLADAFKVTMALIDSVKAGRAIPELPCRGCRSRHLQHAVGQQVRRQRQSPGQLLQLARDEAAPQPDAGIGDGACGGGPPGRPPEPKPRRAGHQRSPDHLLGAGQAWPSLATDPDQLADWPPPRRKPADSATSTTLLHAGVSQFEAAKAESVTGGLAAH